MGDKLMPEMANNQKVISQVFKVKYNAKEEGVQDTHIETPMPGTAIFNKKNGSMTFETNFWSEPVGLRDADKDSLYESIGFDNNGDGKIDDTEYGSFTDGFARLQKVSQKLSTKPQSGVLPEVSETEESISVKTHLAANIGVMAVDHSEDEDPDDNVTGKKPSNIPYAVTSQLGPIMHFSFGDHDNDDKTKMELLRIAVDENLDGKLGEWEQYHDENKLNTLHLGKQSVAKHAKEWIKAQTTKE